MTAEGSERVEHLACTQCGANPSYALINGEGHLVCHCTHVDGTMDPWPVHGFHGHPEQWEYRVEGVVRTDGGEPLQSSDRVLKCPYCPAEFDKRGHRYGHCLHFHREEMDTWSADRREVDGW